MEPLVQYYYKQCYLSYNISYEIVLNVLLWQTYFNPHNIFPVMHACRIMLFCGNKCGHVDIYPCHFVFLTAILMSLINSVHVLSWNIPLFEGHFKGESTEAWNDVTDSHILVLKCYTLIPYITAMPPSVLLVIGYG